MDHLQKQCDFGRNKCKKINEHICIKNRGLVMWFGLAYVRGAEPR